MFIKTLKLFTMNFFYFYAIISFFTAFFLNKRMNRHKKQKTGYYYERIDYVLNFIILFFIWPFAVYCYLKNLIIDFKK